MAVTKIIPIKVNVKASIDYICNKEKTDEKLLVSSYGCSERSAAAIFQMQLNQSKKNTSGKPNLAFHLIQSFSPEDNITPEEAHKLGQEYIDKLFDGKYTFVMSTHMDKGHIHNHFVMCAAQNDYSGKKFRNPNSFIYDMRRVSDKLCKEHGVSVIEEKKGKGKHYIEWLEDKNNPKGSKRTQLQKIIDETIKQSETIEEFFEKLRKRGIEITEGKSKKYGRVIKYKLPDDKYLFRDYNIDKRNNRYTIQAIENRINAIKEFKERKRTERQERLSNMSEHEKFVDKYMTIKSKEMHNTTEVTEENHALLQWKEQQNALLMQQMINDAMFKYGLTIDQFASRKNEIEDIFEEHSNAVQKINTKEQIIRQVIMYCQTYKKTKLFNEHYQKSANKEQYFQTHDSQLLAFDEAKEKLERYGVNVQFINNAYIESLQKQLDKFNQERERIETLNKKLKTEREQIKKWQKSLSIYLGNEKKNDEHNL